MPLEGRFRAGSGVSGLRCGVGSGGSTAWFCSGCVSPSYSRPQVRRIPVGLHASRGRPRSGGSWRAAGRDGRTRWSSRSIVPACLSSTPRRGARAPGAGEPGQSVEGQLAEGALLSPDAAARSSRRKLRRAPAQSQIPGTSRGDGGAEEVILLLRRLGQAFSR